MPLYTAVRTQREPSWRLWLRAQGFKRRISWDDLFLYNRVPGSIWGAGKEFLSCGHLDDLQCAFSTLKGFLRVAVNPDV